jgi:hypothetical protein
MRLPPARPRPTTSRSRESLPDGTYSERGGLACTGAALHDIRDPLDTAVVRAVTEGGCESPLTTQGGEAKDESDRQKTEFYGKIQVVSTPDDCTPVEPSSTGVFTTV